jgi:hypothetical protein
LVEILSRVFLFSNLNRWSTLISIDAGTAVAFGQTPFTANPKSKHISVHQRPSAVEKTEPLMNTDQR